MKLYCIKYFKFTNNKNIKIKCEVDEKLTFIICVSSLALKSLKLLIKRN